MQGQVINGFELKRLLGRGGMAEVWYAENEIGKPAAVKVLNENLSHNQQIVERFHNEALVMVKLNHPNIRQVYGYGYLGNRHCIVMEYLDGEDLEELLKNGRRFTDEELQRWWNQTVDALNYTHAMGIVHRDIKPSNIFLDEYGNIKLLDFGIAKMMENASMTQTGMVMGTPMYMSPEQVNDIKHVDNHTDLYSLAVSFVHMLTGKKPYDDDNCSVFEIQMSIVTKPLDLSEVPEAWRGFLAPYLEKDPQKRPALRRFEAVPPAIKANDDHAGKTESKKQLAATVAAPQPKKPINKPQPKEPTSEGQPKPPLVEPQPSESQDKPKGKIGLWIGLGVAALAVLLVVLLKKPKEEPVVVDHDYVDLGLPSGTLWATCNVGASSPEGYGNYYAWGETSTKSTYDWDTYKYANGNDDKLTKYCNESDYGNNGFTDNLTQLQSGDDAATSAWGSGWRTPSKTQWDELLENTTNKWTTQNGKKGRLFTSKKNGQTLFLPAAGYRWDDELNSAGDDGYYWSSSLDTDSPDSAWYFRFSSYGTYVGSSGRSHGRSVRAVRSSRQN